MSDTTKFMDDLEELIVQTVYISLKEAKDGITVEDARNIVGKVGLRIAFGKDVVDDAIFKVPSAK
jgi:hypothetical protein